MTLRVGVIGVGRFGKEHARVYSKLPGVTLVGVVDRHEERAKEVASRCGTKAFTDYPAILPQVDAVSIAAPTQAHFELAKACLERGIHTLVEKPIARSVAETEQLVQAAGKKNVILQVGHIERFNPAFQAASGWIRNPRLIDIERAAPFRFRSADIDVVLDVMIHDLDLVLALVASDPVKVDAAGRPLMFAHTDLATARLEFDGGCVAHVTANRVAAEQRRRFRAYMDDGTVSIDFAERTCQRATLTEEMARAVKSAPKTESPTEEDLRRFPQEFYRVQTVAATQGREPLEAELDAFLKAVRGEAPTVVPGEHALRVMRVAEKIQREIRGHRWG
jgi:predicted dehydrogenase